MKNLILIIGLMNLLSGCSLLVAIENNHISYLEKREAVNIKVYKDIILGVDQPDMYADIDTKNSLNAVISILKRHGIFKEVDYVDKLAHKPQLILTSYYILNITGENYKEKDAGFRTKGGPFCGLGWALLENATLGLIPVYCSERIRVIFTIKSNMTNDCVNLKKELTRDAMAGWIAIFGLFLPGWDTHFGFSDGESSTNDNMSNTFAEHVVKEIIENDNEILSMIKKARVLDNGR